MVKNFVANMQLCYLCRQTCCKVVPLTFMRFIGYKLNCYQSGILPEMYRDLCFHFDLKSNAMACELITWFLVQSFLKKGK